MRKGCRGGWLRLLKALGLYFSVSDAIVTAGGQNNRSRQGWGGESSRGGSFLSYQGLRAGRDKAGMAWIWESPQLNTGGIRLTTAMRTAVMAIAKQCSHMLLRFTTTSRSDRNFSRF